MLQPIVLLIILIFLNAVFASAEIAVISMNEVKLHKLASEGDTRAVRLERLTEQPARFLATIQVAITLAGLLQSAFAAENFADPLVESLAAAGVPIAPSVLKTISIVVITLILAFFNLVFGELVPKRLAMKKAESMALGMSRMLYSVSKIFAPLVWLLTASTNLVLRLLGIDPNEEDGQVTEEEIRLMLSEGNEQGNIQQEETEIICNVFQFNDITAGEICTHRRDVVLLYIDEAPEEWHETVCSCRHSCYPVCGLNTDEIIGVLDAKDYFRLEDRGRDNILANACNQPYFIPESMKANVLFREMKRTRNYFAVVLDEYGGMEGIITLHDLMEALVGDLSDEESGEEIAEIRRPEEGVWEIRGTAPLRMVSEALGCELDDGECDTWSGFVSGLAGRVPEDGETFTCRKDVFSIEVKEVRNHVIGKTLVRLEPETIKE